MPRCCFCCARWCSTSERSGRCGCGAPLCWRAWWCCSRSYGACRRAAFGHDSIGYSLWSDEGAWRRQANYIGWLAPVLPLLGRAEWAAFPLIGTLHTVWLALAGVTIVGLVAALRRRAPVAAGVFFFGGVWYLASVFPLTGVSYFSPGHLYFPSIGVASGWAASALPRGGAGRWRGR